MIDVEKLGQKGLDKLAKAGKAVLVFRVKKHPDDDEFDAESVSIDLYIVPRGEDEKEPPEELLGQYFKGMISQRTERSERTFAEEVESLFGMWDRIWNRKPKRKPKAVWVVAEPSPDCRDHYERAFYPKTLEAGGPIGLEVALRRKAPSRTEKRTIKL